MHRPTNSGLIVRLMSPIGSYPAETYVTCNSALIVSDGIIYTVTRLAEDEGFSEIDNLTPFEIPLLGSIMLCVEKGERPIYPYPTQQNICLGRPNVPDLTPTTLDECKQWLVAYLRRHRLEHLAIDVVHRPPIIGGVAYDLVASSDRKTSRDVVHKYCKNSDAVYLRGVASLIRANMAFDHAELREAGCLFLWIALEAAHSVILRRLRASGIKNPTARDAAHYVYESYGVDGSWEKFFEEDYEHRVRFMHPDSRFGAEARPWLMADSFLELNENLIDLFYFFATEIPRDRQS